MNELFSGEFIESLQSLRLTLRQVATGGRHAEHPSRDRGGGLEFQDFRSYRVGDDIRRIDWNLYRRSGELFVRLYEEREDVPVYILIDTSQSMKFDLPSRERAARQIAAALTAVSLNQMDRVSIYPFGEQLGCPLTALSGRSGLYQALRFLSNLPISGNTNLTEALIRFGLMKLRSGLVMIVSDFFDPEGIEKVIKAMSGLRHKIVVVQTIHPADANPAFEGEVRLLDCETNNYVEMAITPAILQRYRHAWQKHCSLLHDFSVKSGGVYLPLAVERPVLEQLRELFINGVLVM